MTRSASAPSSRGRVAGKVAVVTGGGSGIGRATALTLAREGASVVVADIDASRGRSVAAEITAAGGRALAQRVDVSVEADVVATMEAATAAFGALHVLHNNAAITDPAHQGRDGTVVDLDAAVWDGTMAVDVGGADVVLQARRAPT